MDKFGLDFENSGSSDLSSGRFIRFYDVEIHQGDEVVKCRIPVGGFEHFARIFLNEHDSCDSRLFLSGMSVFDFDKYCFL